MNENRTLDKYCLRKRIDGINFTMIRNEFSLNHCPENIKLHQKNKIIYEAVLSIKKIFKDGIEHSNKDKTKVILDLNDVFGVYIEIFFKEIDLFVIIQFKGAFFARDNAYLNCKAIMTSLMKKMEGLFRITSIDLAQDFNLGVNEIIPDPAKISTNYKYCFKYGYKKFVESTVKGQKETGFQIYSSRYRITVYDKIHENKKAKNTDKKKYYSELYDQFSENGVTRIEVRLLQENCKGLLIPFFDFKIAEDEFINLALKPFYKKHKLRIKSTVSKDKDFRRWQVHPNWDYIFNSDPSDQYKAKTFPDFLFTNPSKNLEKILNQLIEVLSHLNPGQTEDYIKSAMEKISVGQALEKASLKRKKFEESWFHLDQIRKEVLKNNSCYFNDETGQLGIPYNIPN